VAEEVEAEIRQVKKELAEVERRLGASARRGGRRSWLQLEKSCTRSKWFRIATAVYVHLKKQIRGGRKGRPSFIEVAERRLYGLRLEVVEVASAEDRGGCGPRREDSRR
jgi:hypothetical protein